VREELRPQGHVNAVRGMGEDICAQPTEDRLKATHCHHADGQHLQRRHPFVHQHLICDNLKEQGRQQAKELQEERGHHDLAEVLAVF
jgi:hypothetical protein